MTRANYQDQKIQTVLVAMGISVGRHGIDGDAGPDTNKAIREGANRIYAEMASKMTPVQAIAVANQRELGTQANMEKVLLDKLKDPKFRQDALDTLAKIAPPTEDSIKATKVILEAAGHRINRDPVTGMVDGRMNESTRIALANTVNGQVTAEFKGNTVAQASGAKSEQAIGFFANAPQAGTSFAAASSGAPVVAVRGVQPEVQPVILPQRAPS